MISVALGAHPAACHLHIKACAHRWAQHGNQIDVGVIKAGGQHIGVRQRTDPPRLKLGQDPVTLCLGCVAGYTRSRDTLMRQLKADVLRVFDTGAKKTARRADRQLI